MTYRQILLRRDRLHAATSVLMGIGLLALLSLECSGCKIISITSIKCFTLTANPAMSVLKCLVSPFEEKNVTNRDEASGSNFFDLVLFFEMSNFASGSNFQVVTKCATKSNYDLLPFLKS